MAPAETAAKAATKRRPRPTGWPAWRAPWVQIIAAFLLVMGSSALLERLPVTVAVAASGSLLTVQVDGRTQQVQLSEPVQAVRFPATAPHQREYQIDGSDSTNNFTFDPAYFARLAQSPYYRFQAWLRADASYSRWQRLVIRNGSGRVVEQRQQPAGNVALPLPPAFHLTVDLHRPETPRVIDLLDSHSDAIRITIDRNDRYVQITAVSAAGGEHTLAKRFFPYTWQPSLAEVAYLLMRAAALALVLAAALAVLAVAMPAWRRTVHRRWYGALAVGAAFLVLLASSYGAIALFAKAPHILDAVSYYTQGKIFAGGRLAAPAPPLSGAFPTPFFVDAGGKWFSQYPPGTSLLLAAGFRVGLPWLVEPLLAALATLLTFGIARRQFGARCAALAVVLMATSPFLLLQAGTFLSHVPAMSALALALYAATRYLGGRQQRWIVLGAAALGFAFLCREIAAVLYGAPLFCFVLLRSRHWPKRQLLRDVAVAASCLGVFLLAYLLYNLAQTGAPFLLPRNLLNPSDRFGFGEGIGFYGRHTLGAGLVNTDELLTSLSFSLFGWPYYFALALLLAPFLLRRPLPWDLLHGAIVALFVLAYIGYFYHGIAFGPRYYFEALPSMVILAARGFSSLTQRVSVTLARFGRCKAGTRARNATLGLFVALLACNLIYFLPRQVTLYQGFSGLPGGRGPTMGSFMRQAIPGRVSTLRDALVTTDDWWYYSVYLAALNCPTLDCGTVFAFAPDAASAQAVRAAFPGRTWYALVDSDNRLEAVPAAGAPAP